MRTLVIKTVCSATVSEEWQVAVADDVSDDDALDAVFEGQGEVLGVQTDIYDEHDREVVRVLAE